MFIPGRSCLICIHQPLCDSQGFCSAHAHLIHFTCRTRTRAHVRARTHTPLECRTHTGLAATPPDSNSQHNPSTETPEDALNRMFNVANMAFSTSERSDERRQFVKQLPPVDERLKYGLVEKRNDNTFWQARQICLTEEQLLFAREGSDGIIDEIDLSSVSTCGFAFSKTQRLMTLAQSAGMVSYARTTGVLDSIELSANGKSALPRSNSQDFLPFSPHPSGAGIKDAGPAHAQYFGDNGADVATQGAAGGGRAVSGERSYIRPSDTSSPMRSPSGSLRSFEDDNRRQVLLVMENLKRIELRFTDCASAKSWIVAIRSSVKVAKDRLKALEQSSLPIRVHRTLQRMHSSYAFQLVIFMLILANYILNVLDFEYQPDADDDSEMRARLDALDKAFTYIFAIEVMLNLVVNWIQPFITDPWNLIDVTILAVSMYGLTRCVWMYSLSSVDLRRDSFPLCTGSRGVCACVSSLSSVDLRRHTLSLCGVCVRARERVRVLPGRSRAA